MRQHLVCELRPPACDPVLTIILLRFRRVENATPWMRSDARPAFTTQSSALKTRASPCSATLQSLLGFALENDVLEKAVLGAESSLLRHVAILVHCVDVGPDLIDVRWRPSNPFPS